LLALSSRNAFNPLNAELNPTCHLLALLGAHHILHVSREGLIYLFIYVPTVPTVSACFYLGRVFLTCGLVSTNLRLDVFEKFCQVITRKTCDFMKFALKEIPVCVVRMYVKTYKAGKCCMDR